MTFLCNLPGKNLIVSMQGLNPNENVDIVIRPEDFVFTTVKKEN